MMTQNKRVKKLNSLTVRDCLDEPEFNESFRFPVAVSKLPVSNICLTIRSHENEEKSEYLVTADHVVLYIML